jgi:pimeloyl-ACP methyl ester carboxylesterase
VLFEPVFFRALFLAGDLKAFELAVQFFSAYADRVTGGEPAAVGEMIDYWFGTGSFAEMHPSARKFLTGRAAANGVDVRATLAERLTTDQLASLTTPVLVAYGSASPPAAAAIATALAGLLPRARSRAVSGATHGMLDRHPDTLADLIIAAHEVFG